MRKKRYTVACLSGDGIGPEVTAEASRALAVVSGMHGFQVEEVHVPFGGDALRRFGHPLPSVTRAACAECDAVPAAMLRASPRATNVSAVAPQMPALGPVTPNGSIRHGPCKQ